jgi:hypothetical protein
MKGAKTRPGRIIVRIRRLSAPLAPPRGRPLAAGSFVDTADVYPARESDEVLGTANVADDAGLSTQKGPADWFTGHVYIDAVPVPAWHTHPHRWLR